MRTLICLSLVIFLFSTTEGWSLPSCHGHSSTYHNCFGSYTYANGDEYVGEYEDGEKCGHGTMTYKDGRVKAGEWRDDEYVGGE